MVTLILLVCAISTTRAAESTLTEIDIREPRTIYVDAGLPDDPLNLRWNTIQEGIDNAVDGDTVIVYPGVYTESINFLGKNITLTTAPDSDSKAAGTTTIEGTIQFRGTEAATCKLHGFNIIGSIIGYDWEVYPGGENHTHATISHCTIDNVPTSCGGIIRACDGIITNCIIANINYWCRRAWPVSAITHCHGIIKNCTMVNMRDGIEVAPGQSCAIENCIIYRSSPLYAADDAVINISYSNIYPSPAITFGRGKIDWGPGNIFADPCLADADNGDYHLQSQAGRWDDAAQAWIPDDRTSPCIDAGDPMGAIGFEAFPNGGIINIGAYGATAHASKSYFGQPTCATIIAGDVNGDCIVDFKDVAITLLHWLEDNSP